MSHPEDVCGDVTLFACGKPFPMHTRMVPIVPKSSLTDEQKAKASMQDVRGRPGPDRRRGLCAGCHRWRLVFHLRDVMHRQVRYPLPEGLAEQSGRAGTFPLTFCQGRMKEPADLTFHVDPIEVSTIHDRTTVFDEHMKRPPDSALVIWGPFLTSMRLPALLVALVVDALGLLLAPRQQALLDDLHERGEADAMPDTTGDAHGQVVPVIGTR